MSAGFSCILLLTDWPCPCALIGQMVAELGFSVQQLSEDDTSVRFDLQIVRYGTVFGLFVLTLL